MKLTPLEQRLMAQTGLARMDEEAKDLMRRAGGDAKAALERHERLNAIVGHTLPKDLEAAQAEMRRLTDKRMRRLAEEPDQRSE